MPHTKFVKINPIVLEKKMLHTMTDAKSIAIGILGDSVDLRRQLVSNFTAYIVAGDNICIRTTICAFGYKLL